MYKTKAVMYVVWYYTYQAEQGKNVWHIYMYQNENNESHTIGM